MMTVRSKSDREAAALDCSQRDSSEGDGRTDCFRGLHRRLVSKLEETNGELTAAVERPEASEARLRNRGRTEGFGGRGIAT